MKKQYIIDGATDCLIEIVKKDFENKFSSIFESILKSYISLNEIYEFDEDNKMKLTILYEELTKDKINNVDAILENM